MAQALHILFDCNGVAQVVILAAARERLLSEAVHWVVDHDTVDVGVRIRLVQRLEQEVNISKYLRISQNISEHLKTVAARD
eukprot:SAG31_NODE_1427_length_8392_cov_5.283613_2_plen_81_part_00